MATDTVAFRRCRISDHHLNLTDIVATHHSTLPRQDLGTIMRKPKKFSKLQLLQEDYRSRLLHEKEQKLNALLDRRIRENSLPKKGSVREFFLNRRMLVNSTKVGPRNGATLPPIQPNSRYDNVRSNRKSSVDLQEDVPNTKEARMQVNPGRSKQNNLNQFGDTKEQDEPLSELVKLRKGRRVAQELRRQGLEAKIDQARPSTLQPKERGPNPNVSSNNDSKRPERKVIVASHKKSHSDQVYKRGTKPSLSDETSCNDCTSTSEHVQVVEHESWCTKTELSRSVAKIKELSRRKTDELLQHSPMAATKVPNERKTSQPTTSPRQNSQKFDEMCKLEMELRETISRERKKLLASKRRKDEMNWTGETSTRPAKNSGSKKLKATTQSSVDDAQTSKLDGIRDETSHESPRKRSLSRSTARQPTQKSTEVKFKNAVDSTASVPTTAGELVGCSNCGRRFMKERILKHEKACKKASARKKKPFDARRKRAEGTEMENYLKIEKKTPKKPAMEKKKANWRIKHEHFIQTIRYAKGLQDKPPPPLVNPDYIECSYCQRKFNPSAAQRHIPRCKDIKSRPRPPKR